MTILDSKIMLVDTNEFYIDAFEEYTQIINEYAEKSNLSVITSNKHTKWTEEDLIGWSSMRNTLKEDYDMGKKELKVSIIALEGFDEVDKDKVADIVEKALLQYDINIMFVDEQISLPTMEEFFNKVDEDIGIIKRIKSQQVEVPSNNETRYYQGKFAVQRISDIDSAKKASYKALEDSNKFKKDDVVTLSSNQCWRNRKI